MKIGFDAKRLFNNQSGLGNYSRTLVDNLCKYHPEIESYLYTPKINFPEYKAQFESRTKIILPPKSKRVLYRTIGVKKDIAADNLDVYHGLSHELPRRNEKLDCKKIVTIHDLIFKMHPEYFPFIDRQLYHLKCKHSIQTADTIIAISERTKKDILQYYQPKEEKVVVIPQACNAIYYEDVSQDEIKNTRTKYGLPEEYFLCVGTIEPRKNFKSVVRALEKLPKDNRIPLVIIGRGGTYKKQLEALVASLGLGNEVFIYSNVVTEDLPAIYHQAKMLIYPSFYEGFGLPLVEARLCGTAVMTSDHASLKEAGGKDAIYIDPKSTEDISEKMGYYLGNEAELSSLAKKGQLSARDSFDRRKLTDKLMEIYRS